MILAVCRRIGRQICEKNEGRDVFEDLQERGEPSLEDGDDPVVPGGLLERGEPPLEDLEALEDAVEDAREISVVDETDEDDRDRPVQSIR